MSPETYFVKIHLNFETGENLKSETRNRLFMTSFDFFASPIGLGHVTRDIAVAYNLHDYQVNFVTGSGAAKMLQKLEMQADDVYNPPSFIIENGTLKSPAKWLWNYYHYYKDCKTKSEKIIADHKPDIIISDEDFASLSVAQNLKIPTVLITDILETQFTRGLTSLVEKKMNKSMTEMIKKTDVVIIPENGDDQDNIRRVGPIVRETDFSREELRKKFSFEKRTIIISIGGTNAGLFLIQKAIDAISEIPENLDVIVVSGPSLRKEFKNVRNLGFVDNLHELIYASDLVISLAGKSTIDEANAYGTPGIFIPIKGHFEQEDNAKGEGFQYEDVNRLQKLIQEKLEQVRNPVRTDGAKKAAVIIKNLAEKSNA